MFSAMQDDMSRIPKPGGRVIVKPRACAMRKHDAEKGNIADHEHYSYHVVPAIQNYEELRRTKMKVQLSLDDKRQKWMQTNAI